MNFPLLGKDIYWYGVQAQSLLETGRVHSPDSSPVFYIVAAVFSLNGINEFSLFVFQGLTSLWTFFSLIFVLRISRKEKILIRTISLISIPGILISFLYPKQAWALGFLGISLSYLSPMKIHSVRTWVGWIFLFLSFWFHGFVGVLGSGILIVSQIPQRFRWIPGFCLYSLLLLFPIENERISLSTDYLPLFSAYSLLGLPILLEWMIHIFSETHPSLIVSSLRFFGIALLLPIFPFSEIQFRILISIFYLGTFFRLSTLKNSLLSLLVSLIWIVSFQDKYPSLRYPYEGMYNPASKISQIPDNGLLIARHGFCEFYHFHHKKDCLSFAPDEIALSELEEGKSIYRLVSGFPGDGFLNTVNRKGKKIFPTSVSLGNYYLVKNSDWETYLLHLESIRSPLLKIAKSVSNPYKERPEFLRKKHRK